MKQSLCAFACVLATLVALVALPLAAAPPPGRTVTGIAVDPQRQPVAGAAVWLPPDATTDEEYAAYLHAGPAAVTGADGRFTVSQWADAPEIGIDVCTPGSLTGKIDPGISRQAGSLAAAGVPAGLQRLQGEAPSGVAHHARLDGNRLGGRHGSPCSPPFSPSPSWPLRRRTGR